MKFSLNLVLTCILSLTLVIAIAHQTPSSFAQSGKSPLTLEDVLRAIEKECVAVHNSNGQVKDMSGGGPELVAGLDIQCTRGPVVVPDLGGPLKIPQAKPTPGIPGKN